MKGLVVLGNGFEDTEAIATIDVLRRAKLELDLASMHDTLEVESQTGITINATILFKDVNPNDYAFLVIPGGRAVFNVLDKSERLSEVIKDFANKQKLVAAICAGPSQVGKLGLYENQNYTCFPTTEEQVTHGTLMQDKGVVVSNNFITAKAMAYSIDFGLAIVEYLLGSEKKEQVRSAAFGER